MENTSKSVTKKVKTCTKCGRTSPITDFKRKITVAQARAYYHRQNITKPQTITSSICKACRPKPKPPSKFTLKDIQNKKYTGEMHELLADVLMKQKREKIRQGRSAVMRKYWQDKREQKYQAYEQHLQNQVDKYRNRHYAYKTYLKNLTNPEPKQHAMLEQHRANYEEAKGIRDAEMKRVRNGGEIDMGVRVVELFNLLKRKENDDVGLD
jgi:hypothetical protein